ncbi:MAG: DUF488 family protein [Xanthobacteraceae bacterium]
MTASRDFELLTVGHSNRTAEDFLSLVRNAGVTAIADVRSVPFSRRFPWFSARPLSERLAGRGIAYLAFGDALGGRPADPAFYCDGIADYEAMAEAVVFRDGLARLGDEMRKHRVCLMCSEREPLDCHRCLLAGRVLARRGCAIGHILGDGTVEPHAATEDRLLARVGNGDDLFHDRGARLADAYRRRARAVAARLADRVRPGRRPKAFMPS